MCLCEIIKKEIEENFINIILDAKFGELFVSLNKCNIQEQKRGVLFFIVILNYFNNNMIKQNVDNIELYDCIYKQIIKEYIVLLQKLINSKKFYCLYIKYIKYKHVNELIEYLKKKIHCLKINCCECEKLFLPKTIALLELTGGFSSNDITVKNTFHFYWNNYPFEFLRFQIVDTGGSIEKTLSLLEKYYNLGFRYFVGFSLSTVVTEVLEWFNMHSDAIGISPTSTAPDLSIPKQIYRVTANDTYILEAVYPKLYESETVYYIYSANQVATLNVLNILQNNPNIKNLVIYAVDDNNLTLDNMKTFLENSTDKDSILLYLLFYRENYINFYSEGLTSPSQQYDITGDIIPSIPESSANELTNKYNVVLFKGTQTSYIWRHGYEILGQNNYSIVSLSILQLLNYLTSNNYVDNINSHFSILQFDPVSRDLIYPTFLIETFVLDSFKNTFLTVDNPILGKFIANLQNTNQANSIPHNENENKNKKYNKAIALFELTNSTNNFDFIYKESLLFYWYNNTSFPRFPIIDTTSNIDYTLLLLDKYYSEGYRIFLGFSRSTVLVAVFEWFNNHPDAIGISLFSTAIELNVKKNIYRLEYTDNYIVESINTYLEEAQTVYYIYTSYEIASLNVLQILSENPNINLKSYAIAQDNSNLTVQDLQAFFEGATINDVTVLYIFNEQQYFDLYNQSPALTFPGNQYDILNTYEPLINGQAQNELNNKLFYIQSISPNTSVLWRKNAEYLTEKYQSQLNSTGVCNSLTMIDYLLNNKPVDILASYSGVLEFNPVSKDILYPSFLNSVYKKDVNKFVKQLISFDDPLLGLFEAEFV